MTDRKELITLRCSMYRIAQVVGLKEDIPLDQLMKECEIDFGWNKLGAQICCAIDYKNDLLAENEKVFDQLRAFIYSRMSEEDITAYLDSKKS